LQVAKTRLPRRSEKEIVRIRLENVELNMSKLKTNRGAAKRFKKTGKGGFKRAQSHLNHILTKKTPKRKRQLRSTEQVADSDVKSVKRMLPYS